MQIILLCSKITPMGTLKYSQKKDFAKTVYLSNPGITQKEIAERTGVTEKTISKWVNTENWESLRTSMLTTRQTQLSMLYEQLDKLNLHIQTREDKGGNWASSKEADTIIKLSKAIEQLEKDLSIADVVNVSTKFLDWLRKEDIEKDKELSALFDLFIKDRI